MECLDPAPPAVPRFSLVIPAWNEEALLPRLLDTVDVARARFRRGPDAVEVILADNASTDRTAALARDHGCRVVRVELRSIAAARNGGAHAARGEVVAFVDADMRIHPETFNAIDAALASAKALTSMRKFDRYGDWHYFWLFARLGFLMLRRPHASTQLVRRYWYEDR